MHLLVAPATGNAFYAIYAMQSMLFGAPRLLMGTGGPRGPPVLQNWVTGHAFYAIYALQSTQCNLRDAIYVMQSTRCNLHGAIYAVQTTQRNLCGAINGVHSMRHMLNLFIMHGAEDPQILLTIHWKDRFLDDPKKVM